VRLSADRTRLQADGRDVSVIDVSVVDREGRVVPTASQRLQFEVSGPARLIGMGNGDPGSHEADKPTERHRYVGAAGWRLQGVASADEAAAKVGGDDSGTWRDPFQWVPEHQRPADSAFNVVRTRIPRPETAPGDRLVLFLADIAPGQRVFVNGRETTPRREEGSPVVDIDAATAPAAIDLAYAFATPSRGMRPLLDAAQSGARWALLRVTTPAGPWQRSVFNGHAQVIVQSTGAPGTVSVSAHSEGLTTGTVRLEVDPS
jgi:beta-galactosidase